MKRFFFAWLRVVGIFIIVSAVAGYLAGCFYLLFNNHPAIGGTGLFMFMSILATAASLDRGNWD